MLDQNDQRDHWGRGVLPELSPHAAAPRLHDHNQNSSWVRAKLCHQPEVDWTHCSVATALLAKTCTVFRRGCRKKNQELPTCTGNIASCATCQTIPSRSAFRTSNSRPCSAIPVFRPTPGAATIR